MSRCATPSVLVVSLGVLLSACFAGTSWAQPGTVAAWQTINSLTLGPLGAQIDNADEFGDAVAYLGDLDGAGPSVATVAVGAIGDDDGGSNYGAVWILFLNGSGAVLSHRKISSTQGGFTGVLGTDDELGSSLAWLGDLDGAGPSVAALAVGAIGDDDGGLNRGAVYILFLNATGSVLSTQKVITTQVGLPVSASADDEEFGGAVAHLGDLDGGGASVAAMAVGAIGDDDGGTDRGAAFVVFLNSSGGVTSYSKISDTAGNFSASFSNEDFFAEDLAGLGDLDGAGSGVKSVAVTAVGDDDGGTDRGAVYLLHLTAAGIVSSWNKISATTGGFTGTLATDDAFGTAVTGLGDLDGTGPSTAAIAVSAGGDDGPGLDRGAIYILFLNAAGSVLSHKEISSTAGGIISAQLQNEDEFGAALIALGDIDGAGGAAQTLLSGVGLDDDGGLDRGATYVLFLEGGPSGAPVVSAPPTASVAENAPLTVNVTASDPNGDPITSLTATNVPAGATFTPGAGNTSGSLTWTPSYSQAGSFTVTFTASNALTGSASTTITVTNVDRAPVVTAPPTASGPENALMSVNVTATDADGQAITSLVASDLPTGAIFTPGAGNTSGTLTWTPGFNQSGSHTLAFTATNALSGSSSTVITVGDVDRAPLLSALETAFTVPGAHLSLIAAVSDPDGDPISTLEATNLPPGATFTPGEGNTSGQLDWTPALGQEGSYTVTFTANNSQSASCSTVITVGTPSTAVGPIEPALLRPALTPSPLRTRATLSFRTSQAGAVEVELLDLTGRRVRQLMSESDAAAGVHHVALDGRGDRGELLPSGVYLYRIRAPRSSWSGRVVVTR